MLTLPFQKLPSGIRRFVSQKKISEVLLAGRGNTDGR
jgi:hypothetical protein